MAIALCLEIRRECASAQERGWILAVAASMLTEICSVLGDGVEFSYFATRFIPQE